jgi:drug/metabolite transporter (DMT)-like permease
MAAGEAARVPAIATRTRPIHAYLALFAGVLCISFTAIFTKWASVPGPVAAAYRMGTSALVLAIPFVWQVRQRGKLPRSCATFGALGGVLFALNLGLLNSALLLTSAATATLLDNMAPVWVGIGAVLLFGERLRGRYWLGLAVALAGAAVVTGFNPAAVATMNSGDMLAFVGAVFYASYLLVSQQARRNLDALSYLWPVVVSAAIVLFGASLALHLPLTGYSAGSYWALIGAGVVSQSGGWLLINYALGYLPASTTVVILLGQPVVTGLLSIPLLGESLVPRQVFGGILVLAGIYMCLLKAVAPDPANAPGQQIGRAALALDPGDPLETTLTGTKPQD